MRKMFNASNVVFFTKSHVNDMMLSTLEILELHFNNNFTTLICCDPKVNLL